MKVIRWNVDKVGAYASAICAVHCVLTGVALGLLSVAGLEFLNSPIAEAGFFFTAVVVGTWALVHGIRRHHSVLPAAVFAFGMGSLLVSHFVFGHGEPGKASIGGTVFSVLGGTCLVTFHVLNQRLSHSCNTCDCCA